MNYKQHTYPVVKIGGVETVITPEKILTVLNYTFDGLAAKKSVVRHSLDAVFVTTAGSTFHALGIVGYGTGTAMRIACSQGDTLDSDTLHRATVSMSITLSPSVQYFATQFIVASEKFLTVNPSTTGLRNVQIIGYEVVN